MGKWNQLWMVGINKLIAIKVPVQAQFKDVQTFSSNLDKAEQLNNDLLKIRDQAESLKKEADQKHEALKSLIDAINSKIPPYDKSINNLIKVFEKGMESADFKNNKENEIGQDSCKQLRNSLSQIEGITKDPISLRFEIQIKK